MPLLKLWNTIRGRSNSDAGQNPAPAAAQTQTKPVDGPATATVPAAATPPAAIAVPVRRRLNPFASNHPHAALCKLVRPIVARTVVEIGVEDGSRAIAVMETLLQNRPAAPVVNVSSGDVARADVSNDAAPAVRYIVIDQFEMAGGTTTLKQFHKSLREADVRATVYPETIERGLTRVAHTIGAVDLILISVPTDLWQTVAIESLIKRIAHGSTVVVHRDGSDWKTLPISQTVATKRAA
jgi:hypothetical protein